MLFYKIGVPKNFAVLQKTPVSVGHILERQGMRAVCIKKGKFKDETTLNSMPILSFWSVKMHAKIEAVLFAGTARSKCLK